MELLFDSKNESLSVYFLQMTSKASYRGIIVQPSIPIQVVHLIVAMMVMDTLQYFVHRFMHHNKFLFRHIYSQHHRLVVPYAIGALYNHPLEGLLLDTFGGAISFLISGMTARTAVIFFCLQWLRLLMITADSGCLATFFTPFFRTPQPTMTSTTSYKLGQAPWDPYALHTS